MPAWLATDAQLRRPSSAATANLSLPGRWGMVSRTVPSGLARRSNLPSPQQLRQQEQHEKKLREMQDQVAQGKLVIRQMTPEERRRYPPREPGPGKRSKRG
jgi:hypothetical protein